MRGAMTSGILLTRSSSTSKIFIFQFIIIHSSSSHEERENNKFMHFIQIQLDTKKEQRLITVVKIGKRHR